MKKKNKKIVNKSLSPMRVIILFILNMLFFYGLLCLFLALLVACVTIFTGNFTPIKSATVTNLLPLIIGLVIFYPVVHIRRYLLEH